MFSLSLLTDLRTRLRGYNRQTYSAQKCEKLAAKTTRNQTRHEA